MTSRSFPASPMGEPGNERKSLFDALRRKDANLPHLLDVAVQILRDEGLFDVFEAVLSEDWEAARNDAD